MMGHVAPQKSDNGDPVAAVKADAWPWAAWFPLRATPAFAGLSEAEQQLAWKEIESACAADCGALAHLRLNSHALDRGGNDFVHGLHARNLHDLSRCVDAMRRARLYSEHIASAGPFFVGRALRIGDTLNGPKARW
jgi:chlorite dismutase